MKKIVAFSLVFCMVAVPAFARQITGRVVDEKNQQMAALSGVNIGTREVGDGLRLDKDGNFTHNIPDNQKTVSFYASMGDEMAENIPVPDDGNLGVVVLKKDTTAADKKEEEKAARRAEREKKKSDRDMEKMNREIDAEMDKMARQMERDAKKESRRGERDANKTEKESKKIAECSAKNPPMEAKKNALGMWVCAETAAAKSARETKKATDKNLKAFWDEMEDAERAFNKRIKQLAKNKKAGSK